MKENLKQDRCVYLDIARGVAIIMIVTCHFLLFDGIPGMQALGRAIANTGNFIFFAISAIIFGLQLEQKGSGIFSFHPFLVRRIIRLFSSLWPFLVALIIVYALLRQKVSVLQGAMNFVGLGWFISFPNNGHLWFVTMIIFCYLMYIMSVKCLCISQLCKWMGVKWAMLVAFGCILEVVIDYIHLPGYVFMILCYSFCLFCNAGRFLRSIKTMNSYLILIAVVISSFFAIFSCQYTDYPLFGSVQHFLGNLSGLSWLILILKFAGSIHPQKTLSYLSELSYEIYLVHHCFCCGVISVLHLTDFPVLNYLILWGITLVLAITLKKFAKTANIYLTQKLHVIK